VDAACHCEEIGQLHEAYSDLVGAIAIEPDSRSKAKLIRRAAGIALYLGLDSGAGLWADLARLAVAWGDNGLYADALVHQYWVSGDGGDRDRLEQAEALGADRFGWAALAKATMCWMDGEDSLPWDERSLECAIEVDDHELRVRALVGVGISKAYLGDSQGSVDALAEALDVAIRERFHGAAINIWMNLVESMLHCNDVHGLLDVCARASAHVETFNLNRYRSTVEAMEARVLQAAGRLADAERSIERAREAHFRFGNGAWDAQAVIAANLPITAAKIAVDRGGLSSLRSEIDAAREASSTSQSWNFEVDLLEVHASLLEGNAAQAVERLQSLEIDEAVSMAEVARVLARTGYLARIDVEQHVQLLCARAGESAPLADDLLREAHAYLVADSDIEKLLASAEAWLAAGRPLDAYRVQYAIAVAEARAGDQEAAIARLTDARAAFAKMGAEHDANLAAKLLRELGKRSRADTRESDVEELTHRELEVAQLVTSGMTNAQAGERLHLSPKTIAAHLSNIYGKLEINSRAQLAAWVQEHERSQATGVA
jgi:DNA-binding NarL/FixJ family response regulator